MPVIFSLFSISKWLGVFPFDRDGFSKGWLLFSSFVVFVHSFLMVWHLYSTSFLFGNQFHFYVQRVLLVLAYLPLPLHLYMISSYENCYSHMSSIISQIPLYIDCGVPASLVIWKFLIFGFSPSKFKGFYMPLLIARYTFHIINAQYIVFINSKTRQIKKLRNKVDNYPMASCISLHLISSSVEEIHKIFAPQLLATTVAATGAAVTYSFLMWKAGYDFSFQIFVLLVASENMLLVFSIMWQCSVFESEVKAFYADLFRVVWEQDLCTNKKLVLYLLNQRKTKFSACGFFTLGRPLLTSIIAAVITYLVVLIQFD